MLNEWDFNRFYFQHKYQLTPDNAFKLKQKKQKTFLYTTNLVITLKWNIENKVYEAFFTFYSFFTFFSVTFILFFDFLIILWFFDILYVSFRLFFVFLVFRLFSKAYETFLSELRLKNKTYFVCWKSPTCVSHFKNE